MSLENLFSEYLKHGSYLRGWSPKTVAVYRRAFASFQQSLGVSVQPSSDGSEGCTGPTLTKAQLEAWVVWLREQNRQPTCINIYIRSMNAFFHWAAREERLPKRLNLKQVPNPQKPIKSISDHEVAQILAFRPKWRNSFRTWSLIQLLLDTGLRIDEALNAQLVNADLDNLQIRVRGKGNKERIVPLSIEGRKILFRYSQFRSKYGISSPFLFCTRNGSRISYRNAHRDIKRVCGYAGVEGEHIHPHAFRHKFAVTYIRKGGDIYRLSRILGHASISTTQIYLRSMGIEEIGENHSALTPLARFEPSKRGQ